MRQMNAQKLGTEDFGRIKWKKHGV